MSKIELQHVYVIEDENKHVKIGIAGNVAKRISTLNTSSAYEIINQYESPSCANARDIEKAAHNHFTAHHKKGEWFTVPFTEAVDYVKEHFTNESSVSIDAQALTPELETFIAARVRDEVANALAKPVSVSTTISTSIEVTPDDATRLLEWLRGTGKKYFTNGVIKPRPIVQSGPRFVRKSKVVRELMGILEEQLHVTFIPPKRKGGSKSWKLNTKHVGWS